MPAKQKTSAKYKGDGSEYLNNIPARDLTEDEFAALTDDQKVMLAESPLYDLKYDAPAEAEKAAKKVEKAPDPVPPMQAAAVDAMPAPKDDKKP
jgi:hypothetical protein